MGRNMHYENEMTHATTNMPKFNGFWQWVKTTFTADYRNEIEAYLNESVDHADVERRIINLSRRGMI